jgi:hypothetical protein
MTCRHRMPEDTQARDFASLIPSPKERSGQISPSAGLCIRAPLSNGDCLGARGGLNAATNCKVMQADSDTLATDRNQGLTNWRHGTLHHTDLKPSM